MPLFRDNPVRSAIAATAAVGLGHVVTMLLVSPGASQLLQTSVAIIAIAALALLIVMHNRQEGQLLTHTQEEAVLIGGLALLWVVIVIAWRATTGGSGGGQGSGYPRQSGVKLGSGYRPFSAEGCAPGDVYCQIVEEYYY